MKHFVFLTSLIVTSVSAELPPIQASPIGCAMGHCNAQLQDQTNLPPPPTGSTLSFPTLNDGSQRNDGGSTFGLGCSSNGVDRFACSYANLSNHPPERTNAVVVYDAHGNPVWKSETCMEFLSGGSAPVIDQNGVVFAADSKKLIRVDTRTGEVRQTLFPNPMLPISPIPTANGGVFIAAKGLTVAPPILLVDSKNMTIAGSKILRLSPVDAGYFETVNTPTSSPDGRRAFVLTRYVDAAGNAGTIGRLYALNLDLTNADPSQRITLAWFYEFLAPSGASPTYIDGVIYFDGQISGFFGTKTYVLALKDEGNKGTLKWKKALPSNVQASFAKDPRGGIWVYSYATPYLYRLDTDSFWGGRVLQTINVDELLGVPGISATSSAMTMHGDANDPVLIVGIADKKTLSIREAVDEDPTLTPEEIFKLARGIIAPTYVMAIHVGSGGGSVRASAKTGDDALTLAAGQFAAIPRNGKTAVVFTTLTAGPFFLSAP